MALTRPDLLASAIEVAMAGFAVTGLFGLRNAVGVGEVCGCGNGLGYPCPTPGAHPRRRKHWRSTATTDPAAVVALLDHGPTDNLAACCGGRAGLLVLREHRPGALEDLEDDRGVLSATVTSIGPAGEVHYWYRGAAASVAASDALGQGVTVLGNGSFVPIPGSREPAGVHRWVMPPSKGPFAHLPPRWWARLRFE